MEMMDMPKAIRWLDESCDLLRSIRTNLAALGKSASEPLRAEVRAANRAFADAIFQSTIRASIVIRIIMRDQIPLLFGQGEVFADLQKSFARFDAETDETFRAFDKTPADPAFVSCVDPEDDVETMIKKLRELGDPESAHPA